MKQGNIPIPRVYATDNETGIKHELELSMFAKLEYIVDDDIRLSNDVDWEVNGKKIKSLGGHMITVPVHISDITEANNEGI